MTWFYAHNRPKERILCTAPPILRVIVACCCGGIIKIPLKRRCIGHLGSSCSTIHFQVVGRCLKTVLLYGLNRCRFIGCFFQWHHLHKRPSPASSIRLRKRICFILLFFIFILYIIRFPTRIHCMHIPSQYNSGECHGSISDSAQTRNVDFTFLELHQGTFLQGVCLFQRSLGIIIQAFLLLAHDGKVPPPCYSVVHGSGRPPIEQSADSPLPVCCDCAAGRTEWGKTLPPSTNSSSFSGAIF